MNSDCAILRRRKSEVSMLIEVVKLYDKKKTDDSGRAYIYSDKIISIESRSEIYTNTNIGITHIKSISGHGMLIIEDLDHFVYRLQNSIGPADEVYNEILRQRYNI
jgi:hypothetical protein